MQTTLAIPVEISKVSDHEYLASVRNLSDAATVLASTEAKARDKLRAQVLASLELRDAHVRNWRRLVIGCNDGTVLVTRFVDGCWWYDICGIGRSNASGTSGGATFDATESAMREHAQGSYGGIAWATR